VVEKYANVLAIDCEMEKFLASPYYPSIGGNVIDWMPVEFGDDD